MKFDKDIDSVFSSHIDDINHFLKVSLVKEILSRLNSWPHHTQSDSIESPFLHLKKIIFSKTFLIIGRYFGDKIDTMENPYSAIFIIYHVVLDCELLPQANAKEQKGS